MRKLKPHVKQKCAYCDEWAKWKASSLCSPKVACSEHIPELKKHEDATRDDGHMSEGDRQSWGRYC